jgi:tRNA pseudouridine32 synthase/23S rRNA pseudouridine746 synthase
LNDHSVYAPPPADLQIIFADDSLLVVNKPNGLLAVPGKGPDKQDCLVSRLQVDFPDALTVHRLDMSTSGMMVFARGGAMQRQLSRLFSERRIEKHYVALVAGTLNPGVGEISLPIAADWENRPLRRIDTVRGKYSLTRFRLLSHIDGNSCVELQPVTGRTHQLRLHMSAIGHPILGDALYGKVNSAPRLMLHAFSLKLVHPFSGQSLNLICNPGF